MEKKGEAIGKLLEMVSSPIWLLFWYWGGDREAAEVALRMSDTPMAPDTLRPYPSHDLIHPTMSSLCYSFPTALFPHHSSLRLYIAGHARRILWREI
jgi:hypothetical protein